MKKKSRAIIEKFYYKNIEKDFYEVYAHDGWSIIIEGRVGTDVFNMLMEWAKEDKAFINKAHKNEPLYDDEVQEQLEEYKAENKDLHNRLKSLLKITENYKSEYL